MSDDHRKFETSGSIAVPSTAAAVDLLRDPSTWPKWQSEILRAEGPSPLRAGDHVSGDANMLGFAVGGRADVRRASDREVEHEAIVGIRMNVAYRLSADGDGWILTHRLTAELPRGPAGRVLSFFLKRRLRRMQRSLLADLARAIEGAGAVDQKDAPGEGRPLKAGL